MKNMTLVWKILFSIYVLYVLSEIYLLGHFFLSNPEGLVAPSLRDCIYEITMILFLLGFYGLVTNKKIFKSIFWKTIFIIAFSLQMVETYLFVNEYGVGYFNVFIEPWWGIMFPLITIIAFLSNFTYAFKRKGIWS